MAEPSAIPTNAPHLRLPGAVLNSLRVRLGSDAEQWLGRRLPDVVRWCRSEWALTITGVFEGGSTAVVLGTEGPTGAGVLKIHPRAAAYQRELRGWQVWSGNGLPALLAFDDSRHALLTERVQPATELAAVADPKVARDHAVDVHRRLRAKRNASDMPALSTLIAGRFARAEHLIRHRDSVVTYDMLNRARTTARHLLATTTESSLLHGDFFPDNVLLSDQKGWLAIDPQPCLGDAAFDAGTWSYAYGRGKYLDENAQRFAAGAGLVVARIHGWAFVVAVTNLAGRAAYGHADEREIATTLAACQRFR